MKRAAILFLLFLLSNILAAQDPLEKEIANSLESFETESDENSLLQLADDMELLKSQKININRASMRDLERIPQLDIFQIHNLLEYRRKTGYILSHYELMAVKGFSKDKILEILPLLDFSLKKKNFKLPTKKNIKYSKNEVLIRHKYTLQQRQGFKNLENGFLGDPNSLMLRYKFNFQGKLGAAFHLQKDAGEAFHLPDKKINIDFASYHIFLKDFRFLHSLVIGDFNFEFGQGLALWSGIGFGKSSNVSQIQKFARGIIPYSGGEENRFFRGVATELNLGKIEGSIFFSRRSLDANLEENELGQKEISSFQNSGLHRTTNEILDQNSIQMNILNGSLMYRGNLFSLGINQGFYSTSHHIQEKQNLYQLYNIKGDKWASSSIHANFRHKHLSLFSEISALNYSAFAAVAGLKIKNSEALQFSLLFRNFSKEYQSHFSAPFAEKASSGEKGYYFGIDWIINPLFQWKSYLDYYHFTWPTFQSEFISRGRDYLNQLEFIPSSNFTVYIRFRFRIRDEDRDLEQNFNSSKTIMRKNWRLQLNYSYSESLRLKNRIEISQHNEGSQNGFLVYQDFIFRSIKLPLSYSFRFSVFDISDFENRIYAYENDLSQSFSIPANYGKGQRYYLVIKWKVKKKLSLELKYSNTTFSDRTAISTGLNQIEGNRISELKAQLKYKF